MRLSLALDLPEDAAHLPMVRRVAREALASCRVGGQDLDDIETLVGELTTNAVRHSGSASGYRVEVSLSDGAAVVTVADQGTGFDRSSVAAAGTERAGDSAGGDAGEGRFGGWGLPLVEALADRVEFTPGEPSGTVVRAEKRLAPTPRRPS